MKIGAVIRKSFNWYLNNPIIIIPFFIVGALELVINFVIAGSLKNAIPALKFQSFPYIFFTKEITERVLIILFKYAFWLLLAMLAMIIVGSFLEAFAIGLARRMKGGAKLEHGLKTLNCGFQIIGKKIIIGLLIVTGAFVIILPSVILFGALGFLLSTVILIIYLTAIFVIEFFASQSIVLDNAGSWEGIVNSYHFVRKRVEGVGLLILFLILISAGFFVILSATSMMGSYLLSDVILQIFENGIRLILFSLILAPFSVILKTVYYLKNR